MFFSLKFCVYFQYHTYNFPRYISTSQISYKVIPKNLKKFSKSSQDWLTRHLNDPYVKRAKYEHYRARSAFKLIEIDEKHKLLGPGKIVIDCGAAPGSWTQVVVSKLKDKNGNQNGKVISVDLSYFEKVEGSICLPGHDFNADSTQLAIEKELDGKKVHLILSDMAPKASGARDLDHTQIIDLSYSVLRFAIKNARYGSDFLCKVWDGYKLKEFKNELEKYYERVKLVKPNASRTDSSETFVLGRNFKKILENKS
ncbi:rRNA methyltransferase 2, mitochondrial [Armadillidium vulgare]|nr:rRNA methyltransferase 2, mitochondrial [Armadillidium vulgare]